jgi:hypothetical protein
VLAFSRVSHQYQPMFWRLISAVIALFWAVMTGFIIRDTYFPDHSRFAEIPVSFVFDLFLEEAAAFNNTLHLFQGQQKMGHATFVLRHQDGNEEPVYALAANGSISMPGLKKEADVGFRLMGELMAAERWRQFSIHITSPETDTEADISWKHGDHLPQMEVKKGGKMVMNTEIAKGMLESPAASGWISQMLPAGSLPQAATMRLQAMEGRMVLAGKHRRCYIVTASLMQGYEAKLFFTEIGELARVELPGGYRLIEPMMHGLEPGMKTDF